MTKIEEEIQFLKAFRQRFANSTAYRGAIEDMWREGMITPKAYKAITEDKLVPKEVTKALKKGIPSSSKRVVEIDPCSHGGGYRSSC